MPDNQSPPSPPDNAEAVDAEVMRARALDILPGRSTDAIAAWERAISLSCQPAQVDQTRTGLINALAGAGRYDDCLRYVEQWLPTAANAEERSGYLALRRNILIAKGDTDAAFDASAELLAMMTEPARRVELRRQDARLAAFVSRWKEAASHYDKAIAEIPPNATDARERYQEILLEKVQRLGSHDIEGVVADLDVLDSIWTAPGWPVPIDLRVGGLLAAGKAEEALHWLEQRINRTPPLGLHPATHQLRGNAELKLGHTGKAMLCFARAVELAPNATEPRALGAVLMSAHVTQQWKAVISAYERLGELAPATTSDPDLRVIAAVAYLRLGEFEVALKLTNDAQPTDFQMLLVRDVTRTESQLSLGRYKDSLATAQEAVIRQPDTPTAKPSPALLITLHTLRAQAFNALQDFQAARDAASAALEVAEEPGIDLEGLTVFLRIAARLQRSLALYQLDSKTEAHRDVDAALAAFDRLRNSEILQFVQQVPGFDRFETSLWYAKGAVLDAESRPEEALAAYRRSEALEKHGNAAIIAYGYALSRTGAFASSLAAFEKALTRASSSTERAAALAGKGRALVRLQRFEEAILALQAALDERLTDPENDPDVFELLGIAYDALKRTGAAARAFRRAWLLTPENKRSANLARGVTTAELGLNDPAAALQFLDELPERLRHDRTLLFNRALALDALGRRAAAIACLVEAKKAGLDRAQQELDRLDAPGGLGRWTHYWLGAQAGPGRRAGGVLLLIIAASAFAAPFFQWWMSGKMDWYLLLLPSAVALALLALPNMKSITVGAGPVKLSAEPLPATGRDAAVLSAPETFTVPMLGTVTVSAAEAKVGL